MNECGYNISCTSDVNVNSQRGILRLNESVHCGCLEHMIYQRRPTLFKSDSMCVLKFFKILLLFFLMFPRLPVVGTLVAWESPPEHSYAHSGWTISHQELGWYCMCVAEYLLLDLIHFYTHTHASWKWLHWESWTSDRNAVLHGLKARLAASNYGWIILSW